MVDAFRAERALVYYNLDKLTPAQIKSYTGCTHTVNGWVFNPKTFEPYDWLIVDGAVISEGRYIDWALTIDKAGKPAMSTDYGAPRLLSGVPILRDGKCLYRKLTPDVARIAERTAICWMADGSVFLWVDRKKLSREQLQAALLEYGVVHALMKDGGGSVQGDFPNGKKITSSRKVPTHVLFWTPGATRPACPYSVPAKNVGKWSFGDNVRWLQWQLNQRGYGLKIDGIRGKNTNKALLWFQQSHGLKPDGVCGDLTKKELMIE